MICKGCGLLLSGEEMGLNTAGERVEYHGYQAKCVELLRTERERLLLQNDELKRRLNVILCGKEVPDGEWTPELKATHAARFEFIDAMGQGHCSRTDAAWHLKTYTKRILEESNRLNGELKAALHKIACAECTVHDENCEVRRFSACTDCACDPRVAGAAIPGYVCPVMSAEEKRICEAEHAAGGVFCKLAAGHGGRHDAGDVSWAELH